ncbi:hypothetical protein T11_2870 [Trichinella zimbabwensis]|uniref:Uncharacterized protein n=1 Tax=Trichinella zimbabwensis TaxID=268475 RepID=A0A0V1GIM5_9BILA|nr:hypothetical protein T11_2870 [Trichinella zimbabwensis]
MFLLNFNKIYETFSKIIFKSEMIQSCYVTVVS